MQGSPSRAAFVEEAATGLSIRSSGVGSPPFCTTEPASASVEVGLESPEPPLLPLLPATTPFLTERGVDPAEPPFPASCATWTFLGPAAAIGGGAVSAGVAPAAWWSCVAVCGAGSASWAVGVLLLGVADLLTPAACVTA